MGWHPTNFSAGLRPLATAITIGAVGGAVFAWLRLPLPWMMGAMCLTTASAIGGAKVRVPPPLRMFMIAVLGVMLGSAFRPEMFERAGQWAVSLFGLVAFIASWVVVDVPARFTRGRGSATTPVTQRASRDRTGSPSYR